MVAFRAGASVAAELVAAVVAPVLPAQYLLLEPVGYAHVTGLDFPDLSHGGIRYKPVLHLQFFLASQYTVVAVH